MSMREYNLNGFTEVLSSKAAVPGGGGASALVGAVGVALGQMVGSLTVGKKKYAAVEGEILTMMKQAEEIRESLLALIDGDAEAFLPLSKAYGIPKDDPGRDAVMEAALKQACSVPMEIMRTVCKAIELLVVFGEKGSVIAISDAGVGAVCCRAALQGAALNVYINTKSMKDRSYALALEKEADALLAKYVPMADAVYTKVSERIR